MRCLNHRLGGWRPSLVAAQEKLDLIDGSIGEGSPFHDAFRCYAHGAGPETATLPKGWEDRLVLVQNAGTDLKSAWCLNPLDLAASKLGANRPKDRIFVLAMLTHAMITEIDLLDRISDLPLPATAIARIQANVPRPTRYPAP